MATFWGLLAKTEVVLLITVNLLGFDPNEVDEELLKKPSTLLVDTLDGAGDGGEVPVFPKHNLGLIILARDEGFAVEESISITRHQQ